MSTAWSIEIFDPVKLENGSLRADFWRLSARELG
jgi:hypothetical protein